MNVASVTVPRWAVSTRTRGELLVAGASAPAMELVLLGAAASASAAELEDWLRDLAGVAAETSRADTRERPIPALLYHALAGLLFSQAELWSAPNRRSPCALAFVESPAGAAFGWVGDARVTVHVDGRAIEPDWVRVRDEEGREAHAVRLAPHAHAQVSVEFWPTSARDGEAPASVEADWRAEGREPVAHAPQATMPTNAAEPEPPAEPAATIGSPYATSDRLAREPDHDTPRDPVTSSVSEPSPPTVSEPMQSSVSESAAPSVSEPASARHDESVVAASADASASPDATPPASTTDVDENLMREWGSLSAEQSDALGSLTAPREPHPVARWLGRMFGFARKPQAPLPGIGAHEPEPPVSAYDALLSERVPGTEPVEPASAAEPLVLPLDSAAVADEPASAPSAATPASEPPAPPLLATPDAISQVESMARLLGATPEPEPAASAPTPAPTLDDASSPPAPALDSARERLLRAMQAAESGALPVLHVPVPPTKPDAPLQIDHEPVGADDAFGIPALPAAAHAEPARPAEPEPPRGAGIPSLAEAPHASASAPHVEPSSEPIELEPRASAPVAAMPSAPTSPSAPSSPPRLILSGVGAASARPEPASPAAPSGPPMLRIEPGQQPRVIVPTSPVAPVAATPRAFAPAGAPRGPWPGLEAAARQATASRRRRWLITAIVVVAIGAGWLLGTLTNPTHDGPGPIASLFAKLGLAPAHFTAVVNSSPPGAWIAVDGKDVAKRTPAQVDVPPGEHTLTLTLPDLGSADVPVRGARGERVTVAPSLDGGLEIASSDAGVPITVALDGRPLGYAPVTLQHVAPGLHELQFTGPGMPAWAQTVQVGVRRVETVVAHPMSAPATGVIQVQATLNDEQGSTPLSGAQIFVDGELRGVTPANLELPRGPHSLKLTWRGSAAPVQVIDLPGGNQRFASFAFGLDTPAPQITLMAGVHPASAKTTAMVSAGLQGLTLGDIREAWLHVRTPEGLWRRFPMTAMRGAGGPVVVCVFPPSAFDSRGSARWYVSAATVQGDELFSEMQTATLGGGAKPRAAATAKP